MRTIIIGAVLIVLALSAPSLLDLSCGSCEGIEIVMWNAQNLGPTKLEDGRLERIIREVADYDIIVIQEITDQSGRVPERICGSLVEHACAVSARTGTNRKEQYLIASRYPIHERALIEHRDLERGLYRAVIDIGYANLTLNTIHIKPDRVAQELEAVESILTYEHELLIGDLNADCSYLPEGTRSYLASMRWIISDRADTTASASDCAYDRIATSRDLLGYVRGYRIERSDPELSDHYPVVLVLAQNYISRREER